MKSGMFKVQVVNECKRLRLKVEELSKQIRKLPRGHFYCDRNGKYVKWYIRDGTTRRYLPKDKRALAEKLALRKYYEAQVKECKERLKLLDGVAKKYNQIGETSGIFVTQESAYLELLKPVLEKIDESVMEWLSEVSESEVPYPEKRVHKTMKGDMVRSKSEVIIADALYQNYIPYKYELPIEIGGVLYYPNFSVRRPRNGEVLIWEHHGLMNDEEYRERTFEKHKEYSSSGIYEGNGLIIRNEMSLPKGIEMEQTNNEKKGYVLDESIMHLPNISYYFVVNMV